MALLPFLPAGIYMLRVNKKSALIDALHVSIVCLKDTTREFT